MDYNGISKNITAVGFCENGKWMYTGGEDGTARIWDLRYAETRSVEFLCVKFCNSKNHTWSKAYTG